MGEAKRRKQNDPTFGKGLSYHQFVEKINALSSNPREFSRIIGDYRNYDNFWEYMGKEILPMMAQQDGIDYEIYFDEELQENSIRPKS